MGEGAAIDMGLLPRGVGRCCHFMVFERVGIPLLGEGLGAASEVSAAMRCGDLGVEGALPRLIEPKPLKSGTSTDVRWGTSLLAMLPAMEAEPMGTSGDGEPKAARVLLGVCRSAVVLLLMLLLFRRADGVSACCCCFSGEIDLARSVGQPHGQIHTSRICNQYFQWHATHLLCAQVAPVCLSQFPLRVSCIARCPPVLSSPTTRALISGKLQGPSRPLPQRRL